MLNYLEFAYCNLKNLRFYELEVINICNYKLFGFVKLASDG